MALTPKQERFVREYLVDLNGTQAYVRAFRKGKSGSLNAAAVEASKLLRNPNVAAAVEAAGRKVAAKLEITVERIESELARYAFVPPPGADTEGAIDCEPKDRLKALELLGKRHKMFTDRVEHSLGDMTDEQLEARFRAITSRADGA